MINEENQVNTTESVAGNSQQENIGENRPLNNEHEKKSTENKQSETINGKNEEENKPRRSTMPQDARYSIDLNDRERYVAKYKDYQVSDVNACLLRLVIDHQQKKTLCDQNRSKNIQSTINTVPRPN